MATTKRRRGKKRNGNGRPQIVRGRLPSWPHFPRVFTRLPNGHFQRRHAQLIKRQLRGLGYTVYTRPGLRDVQVYTNPQVPMYQWADVDAEVRARLKGHSFQMPAPPPTPNIDLFGDIFGLWKWREAERAIRRLRR